MEADTNGDVLFRDRALVVEPGRCLGCIPFVDDDLDGGQVLFTLAVEPVANTNESLSVFSEQAGSSTVTGSEGLGDFHAKSGLEGRCLFIS